MTCFPAIDFLWKSRKTLARAFGQSMPKCQATSSKFQTPSSKEAPSSKLQNRPAPRLLLHLFLGFIVLDLELLWSLGVGAWCFARRWRKNCDAGAVVRTEFSTTRSRVLLAVLQFPVTLSFPHQKLELRFDR